MDVGGRDEVCRLARVQVELLETVEQVGPVAATLAAGDVEALALVVDNGVGLPGDLEIGQLNSLGLKLVKSLSQNQLDGSLEISSNPGYVPCLIKLPTRWS